jgi:hypothetical protein
MLRILHLLSTSDCTSLHQRIKTVKFFWTDRNPEQPGQVYTLGAAAYLDARQEQVGAETYSKTIEAANKFLLTHFCSLYEDLRLTLQAFLGKTCCYSSDLALPGFHIFLARRLCHMRDLIPHFDQQFSLLPPLASADPDTAISFTLPIALPSAGGGLDYWEITPKDLQRDLASGKVSSARDYQNREQQKYLPYVPGKVVLQERVLLHRIAATPHVSDEDERVTLQGHAIVRGAEYVLYW